MSLYTIEELKEAVKQSYNVRQVCKKLNIAPYGGNYLMIKKRIEDLQLDTSHFGTKFTKRITSKSLPLDVILTQGSYYTSSNHLKLRLLKQGIFEHKCYNCNKSYTNINGQRVLLPLQLHHIDGDRDNNTLQNLILLCPICHSLTTNFRGGNMKKKQHIQCQQCGKEIRKNKYGLCKDCYVQKNYDQKKQKYVYRDSVTKTYKCTECGVQTKKTQSGLCRTCLNKKMTTPNKPSKEVLQQQVKQHSMLSLGRKYGVSDNAIRKWCKQYGIDYKHGIRKESLQGLKKGNLTQMQRMRLKQICPACGGRKHTTSEICRTCYLKQQLRKKQQYYQKNLDM